MRRCWRSCEPAPHGGLTIDELARRSVAFGSSPPTLPANRRDVTLPDGLCQLDRAVTELGGSLRQAERLGRHVGVGRRVGRLQRLRCDGGRARTGARSGGGRTGLGTFAAPDEIAVLTKLSAGTGASRPAASRGLRHLGAGSRRAGGSPSASFRSHPRRRSRPASGGRVSTGCSRARDSVTDP
jgi:hypothetical protein